MYPQQCAEPIDHASSAARRLNAVAISLSLSRVYTGAQSMEWHFSGLRWTAKWIVVESVATAANVLLD
jgi:hypothetical protein